MNLTKKDFVYIEIYDDWYYDKESGLLKTKNKKWVNNFMNEEFRPSQQTNLQNRDIPQTTDQFNQQDQIRPNYVPEHEMDDYIGDEDTLHSMMQQNRQNENKKDRQIKELKVATPSDETNLQVNAGQMQKSTLQKLINKFSRK